MGTGLKATCSCGYEDESIIGSTRAKHGKVFDFPHFCSDCNSVTRVDVLSDTPCCNKCGSSNVTSYEAKTKHVPNRLFEKLGIEFLHKRGYHTRQEELDPSYCYVLEKTFVMLRWWNYCPRCKTHNMTFYPYIYFD
jgi:Zn finger protein HypA/HybF involved in hydrogenase expression